MKMLLKQCRKEMRAQRKVVQEGLEKVTGDHLIGRMTRLKDQWDGVGGEDDLRVSDQVV